MIDWRKKIKDFKSSPIPNPQTPIIFVVGTTASGKSDLAMRLAKKFDGEIICADSQTVRKDLNLGTAKPSKEDQSAIKHHMLDLIGPYDRFSVADFQVLAKKSISQAKRRNKMPIVVGGTGLYIDSLYFDYELDSDSDTNARKELENKSVEELQDIIEKSKYELPNNPQNPRHLIGVIMRGGVNHSNVKPIKNSYIYGINRPDKEIKQRITQRIDKMFDEGLVEEVRGVVKKYGYPPSELDAICYPIVAEFNNGNISLAEAKEKFARADWHYARRQKAWFKRNKNIVWFDSGVKAYEHILQDLSSE